MSFTFKFYGFKKEDISSNIQHLESMQPELQVEEYAAVAARSASSQEIEVKAEEHDIIELQLSNDVIWNYRADDFKTLLELQPMARSAEDGSLKVPDFFVAESSARGFTDVLIPKSLKVVTGWAAKQTAVLLAKKMESKLILGIHGCNEKLEFTNFDAKAVMADKPYLLFIHGTNSSTFGAFRDLLFNDAYKKLYEKYQGRIIAFEHKTLSESPLRNIVELLNALPSKISLDIVSHSRGGIVADLLARCQNGEVPFNAEELKVIHKNEDLQSLIPQIEEANKAAANKNLQINKMIRVACPAAGTVLIGKKLDNFVNVFCNLLKLIPGADQVMPLTLFLDFAKAVVQERTDLNALPGLEAQMPDSPFMKALNNKIRNIQSDLYVISGDVETSGFWNTLKVFGTNLYFGEAHDLVVNSNSMFKGTYRTSIVKEHFEQESNVNHFNYFKNKSSQNALLTALINPESASEFYAEIGATADITIMHSRALTGKKPLVYLLPGIMGSNLGANDSKIWADYLSLCSGGLAKLKIDNDQVSIQSIHAQTYNVLINYLSTDFDVVPFPYDWRMSVSKAATLLAKSVEEALRDPKRTCHEFHFVAHSMGGLVVRAMIHQHKDVWNKVLKTNKPRVIMLGVPNEGSYGTIRILLGKDSIIKKLALLDFVHSKKFLLEMFKDYPGLIQLLPANYTDIFKPEIWNKMQGLNDEFTGIPSHQTLAEGLELYDAIKNTSYDNDIFRYVAGQDDDTPESFTFLNGKITFTASPQGDGRVLWSTIPATLLPENIYYVPADHGSIPTYEAAFEGFRELLTKGTTKLLTNTQPSTRGGRAVKIMPDSDFVSVPGENELQNALISNKEKPRKQARRQTIKVSVTNGDLINATYPVVVGHFVGDGIVKAEKYLDRALNSKLGEYHDAGNYPGDIGTHLVVLNDGIGLNEDLTCRGGVIVGLGEFGALTENKLVLSLTQAFLTLAIKYNELLKNKPGSNSEFGISALLIGSDFAGLRIDSSIKAILTSVIQANEKLDAMNNIIYQKINRVEIIEIYQHKAIQVGRIINRFMQEDRFVNFKFLPPVMKIVPGALKLIPDDTQQENWQRLEISVVKKGDTANTSSNKPLPIRFVSITDKAHANEELLPTNRLIVDSLISKVAVYAQWDKAFSQTLYELLIPNEFKGFGSTLSNLVLIVDGETARYPWELLHDPNGISDKPMSVNTGIIRQLSTDSYRKHVELNVSNRALVIGNPQTGGKYPDLPAAKNEARKVLNILQSNGLETTDCIEKEDIEIVQKLLVQGYKIIHIASHGIVGTTLDEPTGVIIGKEIVFTAADFSQIRIVPEFVFINACSSNEYDIAIAAKMRRKYDLAASVGTQLIEMGVKAAIVTGWEINDQAADKFSQEFYTQMFNGKGFGDAVHCAREATYESFGQTNTWGAYQCYGDPFYTFRQATFSTRRLTPNFVDTVEVIYEMDNLINEINSALKRPDALDYAKKIEGISNGLHPGWNTDPEIVERFATLYKSLNQYDSAIQYYEKLFTLENAGYTVKSVEQYCNIKVRHAIAQYEASLITKPAASKVINQAISDLKHIHGTTFERYSLIAACYRRLCELTVTDKDSLKQVARYYRLAWEHGEEAFNALHYYPYFNWLHFAVLLAHSKNTDPYLDIPESRTELDKKALSYAVELDSVTPDFYHKIAPSSFYLAELLSSNVAADITKNAKQMEANFRKAWSLSGKPLEKNSYIKYIAFIIGLLKQLPAGNSIKHRDEKELALGNLIEKIG